MLAAADVQNRYRNFTQYFARTRTIVSDVSRSTAVALRDEGASFVAYATLRDQVEALDHRRARLLDILQMETLSRELRASLERTLFEVESKLVALDETKRGAAGGAAHRSASFQVAQ